eukprot:TRINITY_DN4692_c0_g2_i1.p1 TRINITY_DN4692_c0_g2~~TRINITY_DN4692_c0_g2_i1.p1  ORF type:complete len:610 (+),score=87.25 TRINITY_DN4692_c0_g2_i1:44-1873(+)
MEREDDVEVELLSWPAGRISKLVGSVPMRFKDDAVETSFREHNATILTKVLVRAGYVALLFHVISFVAELILLTDNARMSLSSTRFQYLCAIALPMTLLAMLLAFVRVPDLSLPVIVSCAEIVLIFNSKIRYAFFFEGQDARTAFELPLFPETSDSLNLMNIALLMLVYFLLMPVRAKLSLAMLPVVPSLYLLFSLPVPGLEGGRLRIVLLATRLTMLCIIGLMGRVYLETRERTIFFRLVATRKELVKEKVLRFQAEHISEIPGRQDRLACNQDDLQSETAFSVATSNVLSSIVFTPDENINISVTLQLQAMCAIARAEGWLLDAGRVQLDDDGIISSGGFGVVLRGRYHAAEVALKVPRQRTLATSADLTRALGRELRSLRNLCHPSIVTFYGAAIDVATQAVVMIEELVDGESMKTHIMHRQVTDNTRWLFLQQLISVLVYLHEDVGMMHGDIKPSNVMIKRGSLGLKLIDFGLSMQAKPDRAAPGGSLRYMAPEVLLNSPATCSSDIFSFGRLVYFVATSRQPLSESIEMETLKNMARKQELPILDWSGSSVLISCCKELCDACLACAEERPSAADALEVIDSWPVQSEDLDTSQLATPEMRRSL